MLRVQAFLQQTRHGLAGGHTNTLAPVNQPIRRPFQVRPVCRRQVRCHRSEPAFLCIAFVSSHALATVQDFHRRLRYPQLQHLTDQGLGYALAVAFKPSLRRDVHLASLEDAHLTRLCWQRMQCRGINLCKGTGPAAW